MLAVANVRELPLADNSVDLIFTDPPYPTEYLPCYEWLAREAMRVLKPGGFCLAMAGGYNLNKIFRMFDDAGLSFYWKYELEMVGWATGVCWPRGNSSVNITTRTKSILAYSKGESLSRTGTLGMFRSDGADKRFHHWGQDVSSARYYIDCFSRPGDLVLDPFIGGGTTKVACKLIGRRCIGFDIDPHSVDITRQRMAGAAIPMQTSMQTLWFQESQ